MTLLTVFGAIAFYILVMGILSRSLFLRFKIKNETDRWAAAIAVSILLPFVGPLMVGVKIHQFASRPRAKPPSILDVVEIVDAKQCEHAKALVDRFRKNTPVCERG